MKRTVMGVTLGIVLGGVVIYMLNNSVEYTQPEEIIKEVEVETIIDAHAERVRSAQDAARAEIEAKAQEAYDAMYTLEMNKIEADVLYEIEQEIKKQRIDKEEEIGAY